MLTVLAIPAPVDSNDYARSVREDTAELASYFLSDKANRQSPRSFTHQSSQSSPFKSASSPRCSFSEDEDDTATPHAAQSSDTIVEVSEPPSPEEDELDDVHKDDGPSVLSNMLRRSPPESYQEPIDPQNTSHHGLGQSPRIERRPASRRNGSGMFWRPNEDIVPDEALEDTPLLKAKTHASTHQPRYGYVNGNASVDGVDIESQKRPEPRNWLAEGANHIHNLLKSAARPQKWNGKAVLRAVVLEPVKTLPAVFVGLILNILDALSYGMILFPLGNPIFANLGPAGISIFYVSTIVSQLTFSTGSIFKGGVGSELIEVVPFFHNMASTITSIVGQDKPDAVISTTIFCFCLSSLITGAVFFAMGTLKFGYLVGFIPRHILIGCIGGVGWFLVQTGFEVSARLEGSFHYDLTTLRMLFRPETLPLWMIPLGLAICLFVITTLPKFKDNHYILPTFICLEPLIFWIFVTALDTLHPEPLREKGWIFESPPAGEPWWYFYTLFSTSSAWSVVGCHSLTVVTEFELIDFEAVAECIPAMLALTFFGVLHVPINVPALALQTGEDHANLDHELKLHGLSNFLSGCAGSIQNYLVYANSQFFIKSGGNSRLAGYLLAFFTSVIMVIGPVIIGFIPVMMVGTLIFVLGFELLLDALWDPRKKLNWLEYLTVSLAAISLSLPLYTARSHIFPCAVGRCATLSRHMTNSV